jgi:hypothetical protein
VVPSTAIIRLQDTDWAFRKDGAQQFRRVEVHTLGGIADGMQPIQPSGSKDELKDGKEIVANALEFSSAVAGQGK